MTSAITVIEKLKKQKKKPVNIHTITSYMHDADEEKGLSENFPKRLNEKNI